MTALPLSPPPRLAVARIWQEANSFNPVLATLEDFRLREWSRGPAALAEAAGTATELGGLERFLRDRPDWQVSVSRCTSAPPGGPVARAAHAAMTDEIVADMAAGAFDAIYVSLHGAMVAEDALSPDTGLLARIRAAVGPEPLIAVSFDMHACIDPALAGIVDIVSGYRTYPHLDMDATAKRCLAMLERALARGRRPRVSVTEVPFLPVSHGMRTEAGPMRELVELAAAEERAEGLEDVAVFGGFAYADTPNTRAAVVITHDPATDPAPAAARLRAAFLARRADFRLSLPSAPEAIGAALARLRKGARWPITVVDAADNPLSGGIGDTTAMLRALTEAAPEFPSLFCFFHDPELVARAHALGEGAEIRCTLGGRVSADYGAPVPFAGRVERLTDGRFRNSGPMEFGREIRLGRTAVLAAGQMRVVIAETCQSANDPGWCALHGIELSEVALFCIKAKNHFRASFAPLCAEIVDIDCPGPAPLNLGFLRYRHVAPELTS